MSELGLISSSLGDLAAFQETLRPNGSSIIIMVGIINGLTQGLFNPSGIT